MTGKIRWLWLGYGLLCVPPAVSSDRMHTKEVVVAGYARKALPMLVPKGILDIIEGYFVWFATCTHIGDPKVLTSMATMPDSDKHVAFVPPAGLALLCYEGDGCTFKVFDVRQGKMLCYKTYDANLPCTLVYARHAHKDCVVMSHPDKRFSCMELSSKACRYVSLKLVYAPHSFMSVPEVQDHFLSVGGKTYDTIEEVRYWSLRSLHEPVTTFKVPTICHPMAADMGLPCMAFVDRNHFAMFASTSDGRAIQKLLIYHVKAPVRVREVDCFPTYVLPMDSIFVGPWIMALTKDNIMVYDVWHGKCHLIDNAVDHVSSVIPLNPAQVLCEESVDTVYSHRRQTCVYDMGVDTHGRVSMQLRCERYKDNLLAAGIAYVLGGSFVVVDCFFQKVVKVYALT